VIDRDNRIIEINLKKKGHTRESSITQGTRFRAITKRAENWQIAVFNGNVS